MSHTRHNRGILAILAVLLSEASAAERSLPGSHALVAVVPSATRNEPVPCISPASRPEVMKPGPRRYRDTRVTTDLRRALVPVAAPNPIVAAWRWRYEIALVTGLSAVLAAAIISFGVVPTIVAATVITLTTLFWPTARQFAVDRAWCIITPHRVRVGCAQGLIYSSRGKIPVILRTSHQAFGERVLLWCRACTSVDESGQAPSPSQIFGELLTGHPEAASLQAEASHYLALARSSAAVEDQCLRARQPADAHRVIQAERPRQRAPLLWQLILVLLAMTLEGIACYFAAQAFNGSQATTLAWTALFLAVLDGGEVALGFYRDRNLLVGKAPLAGLFAVSGMLGIINGYASTRRAIRLQHHAFPRPRPGRPRAPGRPWPATQADNPGHAPERPLPQQATTLASYWLAICHAVGAAYAAALVTAVSLRLLFAIDSAALGVFDAPGSAEWPEAIQRARQYEITSRKGIAYARHRRLGRAEQRHQGRKADLWWHIGAGYGQSDSAICARLGTRNGANRRLEDRRHQPGNSGLRLPGACHLRRGIGPCPGVGGGLRTGTAEVLLTTAPVQANVLSPRPPGRHAGLAPAPVRLASASPARRYLVPVG